MATCGGGGAWPTWRSEPPPPPAATCPSPVLLSGLAWCGHPAAALPCGPSSAPVPFCWAERAARTVLAVGPTGQLPPQAYTHPLSPFICRYFHAYRIDHILGFFRIWEIPGDCSSGILGRFRPSIPLSRQVGTPRGCTAPPLKPPCCCCTRRMSWRCAVPARLPL